MNNFVNMDKKFIKKGGRKSIAMSKSDLSEKLEEFFKKKKVRYDEEDFSAFIIEEHSKIRKDLSKIDFSTENFTIKEGEFNCTLPNILGFHTLENGFTFLGCLAGGDWECPLFFIIYWDGKSLRGYIPTYGNSYNVDLKCAFGSEMESEDFEDVFEKKYRKEAEKLLGEEIEDPYECDETISTQVYANRYDVEEYDDIDINEEAVIIDIVNRIVLK